MVSKQIKYTPFYVVLAVFTMLLCIYVLISYLRNKEYRKPPAGLMFCKTAADLVFSLTFFIMLLIVDKDNKIYDNNTIRVCNIFGPIFVIAFVASQYYFTTICWDLYRTLSNPFRKPAADSKKLHAFVWLASSIICAVVSPFNVFRYRVSYGICFSCNTGSQFNYYNLWLFYIPIFITNCSGFLVTVFAFRRLSNGLEKTFELRQQIIKKQLILVGLLTSLSIITIISWSILIYAPSFNQEGERCKHDEKYMCLNPYPANPNCVDPSSFASSEKPRILLSSLVFLNGFFDALAWFLIQRVGKKKQYKIAKTFDVASGEMLIGTTSLDHNYIEQRDRQNLNKEQVLCNALRGEIVAYMTAGLEKSIHNTAKETYDKFYSNEQILHVPSLHEDESISFNIEDHMEAPQKVVHPLNCDEREPERAQYPEHLQHDPKSYRGVINQIFIQNTDLLKSSQLSQMKEEEEEVIDDSKMQPMSFEDAPCVRQQTSTSTSSVATVFLSISRTLSRVVSPATYNSNYIPHITATEDDDVVDKDSKITRANGVPFKDYAPHCFRYLRQQIYNISDEEYLESVRPRELKEEHKKLVKEKFSEGRSGAFFFFTHDEKYLIKTVSKQEARLLIKILPEFILHFGNNPDSFINRFFGLHSITMYNLCLYFVVLENVFVAESKPHEIYDIKGSWIDRHTNHHVESGKLMKDQDLHKTLKLYPHLAGNMFKQLKADTKFLAHHNIMDYSVLLGIYYVGIDPSDVNNDRIMLQHHDNAIGVNTIGNYVPPQTNIVAEQSDERLDENEDSMVSNEIFPEDLQTTRTLPEALKQRWRLRAPSYHSGLRKYAQKDKAVKARVIEGPGIYYIGIADVLQEWDTMKKMERLAKVYLRCKSKDGISCVEPAYYRKRFLRKMYRIGIRPVDP